MGAVSCQKTTNNQNLLYIPRLYSGAPGLKTEAGASKITGGRVNMEKDREEYVTSSVTVALKGLLEE